MLRLAEMLAKTEPKLWLSAMEPFWHPLYAIPRHTMKIAN